MIFNFSFNSQDEIEQEGKYFADDSSFEDVPKVQDVNAPQLESDEGNEEFSDERSGKSFQKFSINISKFFNTILYITLNLS